MTWHVLLSMSTAAPCSSSNSTISEWSWFTAKCRGVHPFYKMEYQLRKSCDPRSTIGSPGVDMLATWSCRLSCGVFSINTFRVSVCPPTLARWTADWPFWNATTCHHGDQHDTTMTTCWYIPYFGSRELPRGPVVPSLSPLVHSHKPRPKEYYPAPPVVN